MSAAQHRHEHFMGCVPGWAAGHCPCAPLLPRRSLAEQTHLTGEAFQAQGSSGPVLSRPPAGHPALKESASARTGTRRATASCPVLSQEFHAPRPPGCPFRVWARWSCDSYLSNPGPLRADTVMNEGGALSMEALFNLPLPPVLLAPLPSQRESENQVAKGPKAWAFGVHLLTTST